MDDRQLLERAAAGAGIEIATWSNCQPGGFVKGESGVFWNPLANDGDALRLAVKLRLNVNFEEWDGAEFASAVPHKSHQGWDEVMDDDPTAATRRAIVQAAASLTPNAEVRGASPQGEASRAEGANSTAGLCLGSNHGE